MLFLDNDLRVKSFLPGMTDLFHLRDADISRPTNEIATLLGYADLVSDAARATAVLSSRNVKSRSPKPARLYHAHPAISQGR